MKHSFNVSESYIRAIFDKVDRNEIKDKIFQPFESANEDEEVVAILVDACIILTDDAWPLEMERLDFAFEQWSCFFRDTRMFSKMNPLDPRIYHEVKSLVQEIKEGRIKGMSEQYLASVLRVELCAATIRQIPYPEEIPKFSSALILPVESGTPFLQKFADWSPGT